MFTYFFYQPSAILKLFSVSSSGILIPGHLKNEIKKNNKMKQKKNIYTSIYIYIFFFHEHPFFFVFLSFYLFIFLFLYFFIFIFIFYHGGDQTKMKIYTH